MGEKIFEAHTEMDKFKKKTKLFPPSIFQPPGFDLRSVPFRFHADEIDSQYVRFSVHLNVTDQGEFPAEEWFFVELLAYVWQKSPLDVGGGERVELADVIKRKDKVRADVNLCGKENKSKFWLYCDRTTREKHVLSLKEMRVRSISISVAALYVRLQSAVSAVWVVHRAGGAVLHEQYVYWKHFLLKNHQRTHVSNGFAVDALAVVSLESRMVFSVPGYAYRE